MNPNSHPKRSTISWVLYCVASLLMTASALGQLNGGFTNPDGPITINDRVSGSVPPNKASPYPSTNKVTGAVGLIEKVTVTLNGVSHDSPDDIDMILAGPDDT